MCFDLVSSTLIIIRDSCPSPDENIVTVTMGGKDELIPVVMVLMCT